MKLDFKELVGSRVLIRDVTNVNGPILEAEVHEVSARHVKMSIEGSKPSWYGYFDYRIIEKLEKPL